jgi:hypothetical protein
MAFHVRHIHVERVFQAAQPRVGKHVLLSKTSQRQLSAVLRRQLDPVDFDGFLLHWQIKPHDDAQRAFSDQFDGDFFPIAALQCEIGSLRLAFDPLWEPIDV